MVCLYHPTPSKKNRPTNVTFHEEFGELVCTITTSNKYLMILGDFNLHFDSPQDRDSKLLIQLLDSLDLCQHVSQPKHRHGHILDWVIQRSVHSNLVQSITVENLHLSEHFLLTVETNMSRPRVPRKEIGSRNIKGTDTTSFRKRFG